MAIVVPYNIVNQVELKHNLKDLRKLGRCKYCSPKDLVSLEKTESKSKNCNNCPVFDREFKFCKNHLEFIFEPLKSICEEFDSKIEYFGERQDPINISLDKNINLNTVRQSLSIERIEEFLKNMESLKEKVKFVDSLIEKLYKMKTELIQEKE